MNILADYSAKSWLADVKERNIRRMKNIAEKRLNPNHYNLSEEAKKRLHWLNVLYYEQGGNVTKSGKQNRYIKAVALATKTLFEKKEKDPR